MSVAALSLNHVKKAYSGRVVLNDLVLSLASGEFFGLVGVNGAGKTTLIKCILDLCSVDDGEIAIFGQSHRDSTARTRLTYLPERFMPAAHLTGKDFIRYTLQLHHQPFVAAKVEGVLTALGFDVSNLRRMVKTYSKGMVQKLGLGACFLTNKELLILDEPMSGLDPLARSQLKAFLTSLKAQGRTVFMSTHMLTDVETLCDRMAVLHGGELCFDGAPQEFARRYAADDLDRAFMNCITATQQR